MIGAIRALSGPTQLIIEQFIAAEMDFGQSIATHSAFQMKSTATHQMNRNEKQAQTKER